MEHSCHILLFPFQWRINDLDKKDFSKQISLKNIAFDPNSMWERSITQATDEEKMLFNEKNYFYEFAHGALFDDGEEEGNLMQHYERKETDSGNVLFSFGHGKKTYTLHLKYLNLNLYETGVGVLSFYLYNDTYEDPDDILTINQFARRVYPPYWEEVENRKLLADFVRIEGLNGSYEENFQNYTLADDNIPASYITHLIKDLATNIDIIPVVDDRMYVLSWYKNDKLSKEFSASEEIEPLKQNDFWYKYVFIEAEEMICHNRKMRNRQIEQSTYLRWQGKGAFYGCSRYSFVFLTNSRCPDFLISNFETEYVRMAELVLVQRASVLRFSEEISVLSSDKFDNTYLSKRVNSLRKEFIRFVNQVHFREVTAQDQGIEIYEKLYKFADLQRHVEKLDAEIEELDNYVSMVEDRNINRIAGNLSMVASFFVPATVLSGIFGMNNTWANGLNDGEFSSRLWQNPLFELGLIIIVSILFVLGFYLMKKRKK
ncbi:MAG: hypothetical protein J6Y37_03855 [Paludibacteraceae bacterium]|nr:hypothetical protein [Paludibacteraceae bacterium]